MIRADAVTRRYGSALAVDAATFSVGPGQIVGLIGEAGAGKTTLLRMLATYVEPDEGRMLVGGHDVQREPWWVKRKIGYLAEENPLFESMRLEAFLDFIGRVRGLEGDLAAERQRFVVERCDLAEAAGKRIRECSPPARARIGLAAAILHDPPVLLLDEPSCDLALLRELRPGRAILVASASRAGLDAVATRILSMHAGRIDLGEASEARSS